MNSIITPAFYIGIVEDRLDPIKQGRVRVRVMGLHTHDKAILPTEDLPWAYKVQPTTSGAVSGIGHAPVGVMEGTWVLVQYIDPDKQMPFVVGTLAGAPSSNSTPFESFELFNKENTVQTTDGQTLVTSDGTPVSTGAAEEPKTKEDLKPSGNARSASEFTTSETMIEDIKKKEGFRSSPYQDSGGVWTIGYGSTYLADNSRVTANTPAVTKEQAEALLRQKVKTDFEKAVQAAVRVPITQSMFDALVSLAYNLGPSGMKNSSVLTALNSGDYEGAAANFMKYNKARDSKTGQIVELKGLTNRREFEKNLFLKDGIPTKDGIKETPQSTQNKEAAAAAQPKAQDPSKTPAPSPAPSASVPSTEFGFERSTFSGNQGFKDPKGDYPARNHLDEADTNRLARGEKTRNTVVYEKEVAEHKGVKKANGKGTWDQSKTPYNASYPFNNVWQSESGHILEFDDTKNSERVHLYHRKGTFIEMDSNGTQVNRIVGDNFQIMERNGFVHIVGNLDVAVNGAKTLLIENTLDVQVNGKTTINIHDDAKMNIAGNFEVTTGGHFFVKSGGKFAVDAPRIDLNGNYADHLEGIGVIGGTPVDLDPLYVHSRKDEAALQYETPDDGSSEQVIKYVQKRIQEGTMTKEEFEEKPKEVPLTPEEQKKKEAAPPPVASKETQCGIPKDQKEFTGKEQLSKYFTLSDLTMGYSRKLVDLPRQNLTAADVFCNLKALCENCLDPIKAKYPNMHISSGYRNFIPEGGSKTSDHLIGSAADIQFLNLSRAELYDRVLEIQAMVPYHQLLLEYTTNSRGWIHVAFRRTGGNAGQYFTMNNHSVVGTSLKNFTKIA